MPASAVIWSGPSRFDRQRIVAIATNIRGGDSRNTKVGDMAQVWILRPDMHPVDALAGADRSICPTTCPHLRQPDGTRTCYVNMLPVASIWRAFRDGSYPRLAIPRAAEFLRGRAVRLGAYGDPAAVPLHIWRRLLLHASGWTAYTHAWRDSPAYRHIAMASVESPKERREARALGWRTYRSKPLGVGALRGEIVCPATTEGGHLVTCEACLLCGGTERPAKDIVAEAHGGSRAILSRRLQAAMGG